MAKASRKNTPAAPKAKGKIVVIEAGEVSAPKLQGYHVWRVTAHGKHEEKFKRRGFKGSEYLKGFLGIEKRGRKSPKDLYLEEAERRLRDDKLPPNMTYKEFANKIRDWFIDAYPKKKPPAERMIEQHTRGLWHRVPRPTFSDGN